MATRARKDLRVGAPITPSGTPAKRNGKAAPPVPVMPMGADQAPALSRRHAAGAESARGLLFTVLGELVLPNGGSALTSAFIDVLGRLGVEESSNRVLAVG